MIIFNLILTKIKKTFPIFASYYKNNSLKVKIALFFSILFMSMIVAPTIITLIDQNQDISIFLNLTEEEEETHAKKELKVYTNSTTQ